MTNSCSPAERFHLVLGSLCWMKCASQGLFSLLFITWVEFIRLKALNNTWERGGESHILSSVCVIYCGLDGGGVLAQVHPLLLCTGLSKRSHASFNEPKTNFALISFPPGARCAPHAAPLSAGREMYRTSCTFRLVVLCSLDRVSPLVAYSSCIKHSTQKGGNKPKASVQTFAWAFHYKPVFLVGWKSFVWKFSADLLNVTDTEEAFSVISPFAPLPNLTVFVYFI